MTRRTRPGRPLLPALPLLLGALVPGAVALPAGLAASGSPAPSAAHPPVSWSAVPPSVVRRPPAWPAAAPVGPAPRLPLVRDADAPGPARLAAGGVLGGAAGFFGLGFLGAWLADEAAPPGDDVAAVGGFFLGGLAGEVLGVAGGVHLADGGRGSFWADLGTSALGVVAFVAAAGAVDLDGADAWALTGAAAAAQVGFTVRTEMRTR